MDRNTLEYRLVDTPEDTIVDTIAEDRRVEDRETVVECPVAVVEKYKTEEEFCLVALTNHCVMTKYCNTKVTQQLTL
jgi:uncharacterized protein YejL (UPF0352 family)